MKRNRNRRLRFLVLGVLLMVLINGCGQAGAEETIAPVAEGAAEDEQNGDTAAAGAEDGQNAGTAETGTESAQAEDGQEPVPEDIEIDEETREELTTQLLQENELDTSVVENMKATRGCTFTLPEGFSEVEDMPGMYVTKRYPIDASTIYYVEMDKDISLQLMTEETFLAQIQRNFNDIYGEEIAVDLKSYEKIEIDGYPAFRILCTYIADGIEITQLEYVVNADKSYVITYSQTNEYDRMEAFEASAATIHLEIE